MARRLAVTGLLASLAITAASCGRSPAPAPKSAEVPPVSIGRESVVVVAREQIRTGPLLSGELRAAREATARAEVGGSVLEVLADEGQALKRGDVIARIEALAIQDGWTSAQSGVRSAEQALRVAEREAERVVSLVKGGALAERDLELARTTVAAAEAQLADAKARLAMAKKLLDATTIRAPLTGIVSSRAVNAGDVVSPGGPLFTIIDPSSMELAASVSSDALGALRIGAPVDFEVRGYPDQTFTGKIARINPAADPVTQQVAIYVSIPNTGGKLVAGLFAEGRVTTEARQALVVPAIAVNAAGQAAWVLRVREGKAERVEVQLGMRDDRTERIEIRSGVAEGDVLLVGAAQAVTPGAPVRIGDTAHRADGR